MSEARKMERIVKEVLQERELRRHLSNGALVRYHDGRLDDTELRWHIERHLELCTTCRERFEAVTHIHLSEEELIDYHDGQVSNPHTLARIRAHLEAERCPLCTNWLAEFQQAEDETAAWLATHALVSEEETPAAVAQGLGAMLQRLAMRVQRPWAVVTALLHPPLVPAAVHATTTYPRVHIAPGGELTCVINKTEDGSLTLTFENQRVEWAGGLLEFACCAIETSEVLLSGFSVLPEAPRSASESAVCLSPEATVQLDTAFQVVVYPIGLEELTDDDVESLRWSATLAADEGSRAAWCAFSQRLREGAPAGSPLHAWAEEVTRALEQEQQAPPMAASAREQQAPPVAHKSAPRFPHAQTRRQEEEESKELTLLLAASEGHGIAAGENPQAQLTLVPVGTFEVEGIRYEALADVERNVFLQPSPVLGKTYLVLYDVPYVLRRAGGDEGRCQVIGLGQGQLEFFFALRSIEEDQHRIGFKE